MASNDSSRLDIHNGIVQQWSPDRSQRQSDSESPVPELYSGRSSGHSPDTPANEEEENERYWRDKDLNARMMKNADEFGIERPQGHRVSFHYNSGVEDMHFGRMHPMKPWRLTLTKHLVMSYGLQYSMNSFEAVAARKDQVCAFHDPDYVDFLVELSPQAFPALCKNPRYAAHTPPGSENDTVTLGPFNLSTSPGADCPVFDGMSKYLFLYTGATLAATQQLTSGQSDIAINWSGGLHHAHKAEASGFCYINDIVLAILDMLRVHARVLYIDIDVHHGDGVEEAFQRQPRVMTLSFHRYGPYDDTGHKFFPGTGDITDNGLKGTVGEHFALNVPISSGIDDRQYKTIFEGVTSRVIEAYNPKAIVLQCGADSLGGDRLGQFNINIKQHGQCVSFIKEQKIPLLLLGGGGYTARNVARAWCHETALATDNTLPDMIPLDMVPRPQAFKGRNNGDGKLYPPFQRLHPNECKDADLENMIKKIEWDLKYVKNAPWVKFDQLPKEGAMDRIIAAVDEQRRGQKAERERERRRREQERNTGGRGELR